MMIWLMMRQDDQQKGPVIGRLVQFYCPPVVCLCFLVLCNTSWPIPSSCSCLLTVLGVSLRAARAIDSIVSLNSSFNHRIRFAFALITILFYGLQFIGFTDLEISSLSGFSLAPVVRLLPFVFPKASVGIRSISVIMLILLCDIHLVLS